MDKNADRGAISHLSQPTEWPRIPTVMSWSQLMALESCPLQWALSNATYEDIWNKRGYPRRFSIQQLRGLVIHNAIDVILKNFRLNRCFDLRSAEAVELLRAQGGFNGVLQQSLQRQMLIVEESPRMNHLADYIRRKLESLVESMTTVVKRKIGQAYASSGELESEANFREPQPPDNAEGLGFGIHSEVRLKSEVMGWIGDADEIILTPETCEIVDSKTGKKKDEHIDQLMAYAAIWSQDGTNNPIGRLADRLTVSYDDGDVLIEGPNQEEIDRLVEQLKQRTETVRDSLVVMPPTANPSYENCSLCSVKQLCEIYWSTDTQIQLASHPDAKSDFVDAQLRLTHKRSDTLYMASLESAMHMETGIQVVLRTKSVDPELAVGRTVRINNLRRVIPSEAERPNELVYTRWSERFVLPDAKL